MGLGFGAPSADEVGDEEAVACGAVIAKLLTPSNECRCGAKKRACVGPGLVSHFFLGVLHSAPACLPVYASF